MPYVITVQKFNPSVFAILFYFQTSKRLIDVIFFFGMSNSLVNPLIYGAFHLHTIKSKSSDKGGNGGYSLNR